MRCPAVSDTLLSVGLDVGTTTTQMVVSRLWIENRAGSFSVPQMEITRREILFRSEVVQTPLVGDLVDQDAIAKQVKCWYDQANIKSAQVDTGAVIITGETSRKENAARVLQSISHLAGSFVAATAGPDLESRLAAKGSGANRYSQETGCRVLHMDIGGGTSNLALIENGELLATGCLNIGGRLLRISEGKVLWRSAVLAHLPEFAPGSVVTPEQLTDLAESLTQVLEMAAGLREVDARLSHFLTKEVASAWQIPAPGAVISFSGGVADCIESKLPGDAYKDLGPYLGQAIKKSALCKGKYRLGQETIRATVIGAGCHSAVLSGSTVFYQGVPLPVQDLPVMGLPWQATKEEMQKMLQQAEDGFAMLAFTDLPQADYKTVTALAEKILWATGNKPVYVCLTGDFAKALGQKMALSAPDRPILCIDRIFATEGQYLDIGSPVGSALPVVIKTLVLEYGGAL